MKKFSHIILSHHTVQPILTALQRRKGSVEASLDLHRTTVELVLKDDKVIFPDQQEVGERELAKIAEHKNRCYVIFENQAVPIVVHSETTNWVRTLYPTGGAPTTLVSGILMHRIKDTDPWLDTQEKIATLGSLTGAHVLDTSTGLGYTAIQAAALAQSVVTVELDPAAIDVCKLNPWSHELFTSENITQKLGSITDWVKELDPAFTHILHDPPTFKLAGHLYSSELYRYFYQLLRPGGTLFHYVADPDSKHGAQVIPGVKNRLEQAGFSSIKLAPQAFGIVAEKR